MSCCGHGGSWFGKCRNAGNANFGHTWHEGIRVCKSRQYQKAVRQHLYSGASNNAAGDDAIISMNSKAVVVATQMLTSVKRAIIPTDNPSVTPQTKMISASTYVFMTISSHTSVSTTLKCNKILHVVIHISMIFAFAGC